VGVGVGVNPLSFIFYKNCITCAKEIIVFAYFLLVTQTPRNEFARKVQGTLQMGQKVIIIDFCENLGYRLHPPLFAGLSSTKYI